MKTINHYILAAAMLTAGVANAQAPTNTYQGAPQRAVTAPVNPGRTNGQVSGASAGTYNQDYNAYSQDSYVNQAGSNNNATVDQSDTRSSRMYGGSTAIISQTGDNNTANQTQTLAPSAFNNQAGRTDVRDFVKSSQAGTLSQSDQTQHGGGFNTEIVNQGAGTSRNRAIQTQNIDATGGDGNQATINQTSFRTAGSGSGNRAEQTQSGLTEVAKIDQESSNSFAKQTQSGGSPFYVDGNQAYIHQGDPGNANTAMQTQSGLANKARIQQAVGVTANNNYALQNQTENNNQADITQQSSGNYAEQRQSGLAGGGDNYSSVTQSNVISAAYTVQSGNANTAVVTQH